MNSTLLRTLLNLALCCVIFVGAREAVGERVGQASTLAQAPTKIDPDLAVGGLTIDFIVSGSTVYAMAGEQLAVLDVSDRDRPSVVARSEVLGRIRSLAHYDRFVYFVSDESGIGVIDVTVPERPTQIDRVVAGQHFSLVAVTDDLLVALDRGDYITRGPQIVVFDLIDPRHPRERSSASFFQGDYLSVAEGHAYVSYAGGIRIFDLDPLRELAFHEIRSAKIAADGRRLAVLNPPLLTLYDVHPESGAATPLGSIDLEAGSQINSVRFEDDLIIVLTTVYGGTIVVESHSVMSLVDISSPSEPRLLSSFQDPATDGDNEWLKAAMLEGRLVLAKLYGGFDILDISTPAAPTLSASLNFPNAEVGMMRIGERLLFAGRGGGLQSLDRATLGHVGSADPVQAAAVTMDLDFDDGYAVVADSGVGSRIFSISSDAEIEEVGRAGSAWSSLVDLDWPMLYEGSNTAGTSHVAIYSMRDPATPLDHGFVTFDDPLWSIAAKDGIVYVGLRTRDERSLSIIDARDPTRPREVDRLEATGVNDLVIVGDLLFASIRETDELDRPLVGRIYDISNPLAPRAMPDFPIPSPLYYSWSGNSVTVHGDTAWFSGSTFSNGRNHGAYAVDVSDPENPFVKGRIEFSMAGGRIFFDDEWAYTYGMSSIARYSLPLSIEPLVAPRPVGSPTPAATRTTRATDSPSETATAEPTVPPTALTPDGERWTLFLPRLDTVR